MRNQQPCVPAMTSPSQSTNGPPQGKTSRNGPYQGQPSRIIGTSLRIYQINAEGMSRAKSDYLARSTKDLDIDIILLQETHIRDETCESKLRVNGFKLIAAVHHAKYGVATYLRHDLTDFCVLEESSNNDIFTATVKVGDITITNIYKPPKTNWPSPALQTHTHPEVHAGDFNSHHSSWGYAKDDENGEQLDMWASACDRYLLHDAKQPGTFHSSRWRRDYNPDLCFLSKTSNGRPLHASRKILPLFPHSQHRPALIHIGVEIPLIQSKPQPRWNFRKADWKAFTDDVEEQITNLEPVPKSYTSFCNILKDTAKKHIPRGFRKVFTPCWLPESEELLKQYESTGDPDIATELLDSLDTARQKRWQETVEDLNFTHSSRKAWNLLRHLGAATPVQHQPPKVTANAVASRLLLNSKVPSTKASRKEVKKNLSKSYSTSAKTSPLARPYTREDVDIGLSSTKSGKAAGIDGIYPEFLKNLGPKGRGWLASFFTHIHSSGVIPKAWRESKVIAIIKPGKPANDPASYRPISLLCTSYKLFERLLLVRLSPLVEPVLPKEQAGFRPKRSCSDQVLALTTFIEAGYQRALKTGVALIDLSSAYDTVWRHGLLLKASRIFKCQTTMRILASILSNRRFRVSLGGQTSSARTLNDGLPQGSVLAPMLFNIYVSDMPETTSRKFAYADDLALATQSTDFNVLSRTLTEDMKKMEDYFTYWRLRPNPNKTTTTAFHLSNRQAKTELNVTFCGKTVKHEEFPKYLGVTLDRSLTYREHLKRVSGKLKTRVNIIRKLAGNSWGSGTQTLRTACIALVYSVAEYCSPVWTESCHTKKVDVILNSAMRIITGTLKSTPLQWLPALSHIAPPGVRRQEIMRKELHRTSTNPDLPIHEDLGNLPKMRLKSRTPFWTSAKSLEEFDLKGEWRKTWAESDFPNHDLVQDPTSEPAGFNLPRKQWVTLNRIRTLHARSAHHLHRWKMKDSPACDCGNPDQTVKHVVNDCPLRCFPDSFEGIHQTTDAALTWLRNLDLNL